MAAKIGLTEGTFYISATAAAGKVLLPSNMVLEGRGLGVTTLKLVDNGATAGQTIISNSDRTGGNQDIEIRNLTIDGNSANQVTDNFRGLDAVTVSRLTLSRVGLQNIPSGALQFGGSSSDIKVLYCYLINTGGLNAGTPTTITGLLVEGCTIDSSARGGDAIGLLADTNRDLRIIGNRLIVGTTPATAQAVAIEVWGLDGCLISNNYIHGGNSTEDWGISAVHGGDNAHLKVSNNIIMGCHGYSLELIGGNINCTGNVIYYCGTAILNAAGEAIFTNNSVINSPASCTDQVVIYGTSNNVLIQGNMISRGHGSSGLYLNTVTGPVDILDNLFISLNQENFKGINLTNSPNVNMRNNTFRGYNAAGDVCIQVDAGSSGSIVGNDLRGCLTPIGGDHSGFTVRRNEGHATENSGATLVADGGTITHGLAAKPTRVRVTPSVAGEMAAVTAIASSPATTFTVALKKHDGTAGTTQTVYWEAEVA